MFTPARKGDLIVIAESHSSTSRDFRVSRYVEYRIARVESATREGVVKMFRHHDNGGTREVTPRVEVNTLSPEAQEAAKVIFSAEYPGITFDDVESLKSAIRENLK